MGKRVAALIVIYLGCSLGWFILGSSVFLRTKSFSPMLEGRVERLWGGEHVQRPPDAFYTIEKVREEQEPLGDGTTRVKRVVYEENIDIPLVKTGAGVKLRYEPRKKGLLWYSTYSVDFKGKYAFKNKGDEKRLVHFAFNFPSSDAQYDNFQLRGPDGEIEYVNNHGRVTFEQELGAGRTFDFTVAYRSRGLGGWFYMFSSTPGSDFYTGKSVEVSEVRNFRLQMETDFDRIDFPEGTMSPQSKVKTADGWKLTWKYKRLITGLNVGMQLPEELNPGPLASRMTFFAPVSLLFFIFILFIITVLKKIDLHPMHYFFLSLSFFAFHLLFAYLVDHIDVYAAFILSAVMSTFLVISYIRLVVSSRFAFVETGLLQLLYLVVFSYTHFFKGYTGLIVTVFAVLTLFFVMQLTARVRWSEVFAGKQSP